MVVESAGRHASGNDKFDIYINNRMLDFASSRGWNIVQFHENTFEIKEHKVFDTYSTSFSCSGWPRNNNNAFVSYIDTIPSNTIVAYGVHDEAQYCTESNLYSKLTRLGYPSGHEITYRGSFAALSHKGAPAGTALYKDTKDTSYVAKIEKCV